MCRITGFWDFDYKKNYNFKKISFSMRDALIYGGPDDYGSYFDNEENLNLSMRRLSILDLSKKGSQPINFKQYSIVFNGEIYNFKEIRNDLEKLGYNFISNTDTEVVLKAFHRWGFKSVSRFRGMWAFAIWDRDKKKLILCRDRIGVKPLYWYYNDNIFLFSSELKAFHKHPKFKKNINKTGLSLFFQHGYITAPYSIFDNTFKLEPGKFLIIDKKGKINKKTYWSLKKQFLDSSNKDNFKKDEDQIAEELKLILKESFKLRMVSDVPVGMFLSGGIDSSLLVSILQKEYSKPLKTFTIGFEEKKYNEAEHAKELADYLGTDHTELYCTPEDANDIIPDLPYIFDEPFADPSSIPTILVSRLAKEKVKVSLSADGGDEQFCGYPKYWNFIKKEKISKLPFSNQIYKVLNLFNLEYLLDTDLKNFPSLPKNNLRSKYIKTKELFKTKSFVEKYNLINKQLLNFDLQKIGLNSYTDNSFKFEEEDIDKLDNFSRMMFMDLATYLPDDILTKVDRATMHTALEGRDPFLDNKLIEYSSRLHPKFKYNKGVGKYILRKILYQEVPKKLVDRPKKGFSTPISQWFKSELKKYYKEYLNENKIKKEEMFDSKHISNTLSKYLKNRGSNSDSVKLWRLFIFQQWKDKWL